MVSFTIQNVLIAVSDDYATVDVQIVDGVAPNLQVIGTAINGKNKLLLPGFFNAHTHSSEMWQRGIMSIPFRIIVGGTV